MGSSPSLCKNEFLKFILIQTRMLFRHAYVLNLCTFQRSFNIQPDVVYAFLKALLNNVEVCYLSFYYNANCFKVLDADNLVLATLCLLPCAYINTHRHTHTHIYIYIYIMLIKIKVQSKYE